MIPFIIGGVALAATGYGVAKLLENDCLNNKSIDDSFDRYENGIDDFFNGINSKVNKAFEDDKKSDEKTEPFYIELDDENYTPQEDEAIEKYELAKIKLYNSSLLELRVALSEIENLDREIFIPTLAFEKKIYPFEKLTDEIKQCFEKYTNILQKTKEYVDDKLDTLDSIIISESDYEKYSDEDKKFVDKLMHLCTLVDKATQSRMTNDNVTISREVNRGFAKLETIIL
ncbi:MAG: hypothetical protein IE909_13245 [Campylobacterales bacterium]|nr:hypothetical protein [Campylobacterales bacterium]